MWYTQDIREVLLEFKTNAKKGLSSQEANSRIKRHGANAYAEEKRDSILKMILVQFKNLANIVLLFAAVISLALAIREGHGYFESFVIFAVILMNITLAITQERSAEKALDALRSMSSPTCYVIRDGGKLKIGTEQVVPGDIIVLRTGDFIAADARIIQSTDLYADESALTGESEPAEKDAFSHPVKNAPLGDQHNMLFAGCFITGGNGTAVVVATGMDTQMGTIAGFLSKAPTLKTPLQKRLNRVNSVLTTIAILAAFALVGVGVSQGSDIWTILLAAVALAVAAIPETLQLIVTLSLTHSVRKMAEQNTLVRKLPAVETLGNTSVICSDKTGTLTKNQMTIMRLWTPSDSTFEAEGEFNNEELGFLKKLALASNATIEATSKGQQIVGDATESAIVRLLIEKEVDLEALRTQWPRVAEIPFSSDRKMMTSIFEYPEGGYLVLTKGAFDRISFVCNQDDNCTNRNQVHDEFAQDALRVIALGSTFIQELPRQEELPSLEQNLTFEGFIGLIDPPREEAIEAIRTAKQAGIKTIMITGDHAATAQAIAQKVGLLSGGGGVLTGQELSEMSDQDLADRITEFSVYARVSPEDKIRIVEAWQDRGEVVAMTGDGVNDAPALKTADVGIAMGRTGTEVAKNASDIILIDDNYATIISAVREGRNVFENIRKTLEFLLVANLSEIIILLGAQIVGWGIALTPVMILLINMLGNGIPGLSLPRERNDDRIMNRKPVSRTETFFDERLRRAIVVQTLTFAFVGLTAYYLGAFVDLPGGAPLSAMTGQTMAFLVIAFTGVLHVFNVRATGSVFKRTVTDNMPLTLSAFAMLALFALMALIPPFGALFGLTALGLLDWLIVIVLALFPTLTAEMLKRWERCREAKLYQDRIIKEDLDREE